MKQYLELVQRIIDEGERTPTRTGIDTLSIFGAMCQYDLRDGFPLLTTKKVLFDTVVDELLWFIRGGHNIHDQDAPKRIWNDWADESGELGRIYGVQWREWLGYQEEPLAGEGAMFPRMPTGYPRIKPYDQLQLAIERIKKAPHSRRNLVSAWNVAELEQGQVSFPPCHVLFQFRVAAEGTRLDLAMYQRSCDMALGVPFNIASYALLLSMVANECHLDPGIFTHFMADAHVYVNHLEKLNIQLHRLPYPLPSVFVTPGKKVVEMRKEDIELHNYRHHSFLRFEVAV